MRFGIKMFFLSLVMLLIADAAEGKAWRGIFPLRSTRAEVSRAFGPCVSEDHSCTYEMSEERVKFFFVSKSCGPTQMKHPSDLVLRIEVKPKKDAKISDFVNYARAVTLSVISDKGSHEAIADNEARGGDRNRRALRAYRTHTHKIVSCFRPVRLYSG